MVLISKTQKTWPTTIQATAKPKAIVISNLVVTDPLLDYVRLYQYPTAADATNHTNFTIIGPIYERKYRDEEALVDEVNYWYRASYFDIYGNESAKSNAVNETNKKIATVDIAPAAIIPEILADNAVIPSKQEPRDTSNMLRDPELSSDALWTTTYTVSGTPTAYTKTQELNASPSKGYSKYRYRLQGSTVSSIVHNFTFSSDVTLAVEPGRDYYISVWGQCASASSGPAMVSLGVRWYGFDAAGNPTFISPSSLPGVNLSGATGQYVNGMVQAPAGASRASFIFQITVANSPGVAPDVYLSSPVFKQAVDGPLLSAGSATTAKIAASAVTQKVQAFKSSNTTIGTGNTLVDTITIDPGNDYEWMVINACMKVVDAGTYQLLIQDGSTTVYTGAAVTIAAAGQFNFHRAFGSGTFDVGSSNINFRMNRSAGSGDVTESFFEAIAYKR